MAIIETQDPTRVVFNQPPPLEGYNLYLENRPLVEATHREGAGWAEDRLGAKGAGAAGGRGGRGGGEGAGEALEGGRLVTETPPILRTHDRYGNRIDEVEFH